VNLYLLVEGSRPEKTVYPRWLSALVPALTQVFDPFEAVKNNFYLFSSNGYPGIKGDIRSAILDVNEAGIYDYFVVCLDSDDSDVDEKRLEIEDAVSALDVKLNAGLVVIIQCRCIETWFLGNRDKVPARKSRAFYSFFRFYNVSKYNPELMEKPSWFSSSISQFHAVYLKKMLAENGKHYSKKSPESVCGASYLTELQKRVIDSTHLRSLKYFFDFCQILNEIIEKENIEIIEKESNESNESNEAI
jgi:hypothetical protein